MTNQSKHLSPASLLRAIVTAAGYRRSLSKSSLKDLDDIASTNPSRPTPSVLIDKIERELFSILREDGGELWTNLLSEHWTDLRSFLVYLSKKQKSYCTDPGYIKELTTQLLTELFISYFSRSIEKGAGEPRPVHLVA